jgi:hypothetical protein
VNVFRPWTHLLLAIKATIGAVIWLFLPTAMLALSTRPDEALVVPALISVLGGILLIPVVSWLPLLQSHQTAARRFLDIFDVRTARTIIARVPVHWAIATILLHVAAIPLYLTKVRLLADDAIWLLTPLFIVLINPTRLLFGWVDSRGQRRPEAGRCICRWPVKVRWPVKLVMIPALAACADILFVTPFISEGGRAAIFEHHAFLLPVPGRLFGS